MKIRLAQSLLLLSGLIGSLAAATALLRVERGVRWGLYLGIALAAFNGLIAFLTLAWAYQKSDKIFFGTFFGNMVWKLAVLMVSALWLLKFHQVHIPSALISMAALTLFINLIEMNLFPSESGSQTLGL